MKPCSLHRSLHLAYLLALLALTSTHANAQDHNTGDRDHTSIEQIVLSTCFVDTPWSPEQVRLSTDLPPGGRYFYNARYTQTFLIKKQVLLIITNALGQVTQREIETSAPQSEEFHTRSIYNRPETFTFDYVKSDIEKKVRAQMNARGPFQCKA